MSERALWLDDALQRADVRLIKVDGWKHRGHPFVFEPIGVMHHHTASPANSGNKPSLGVVTFGRSDLDGPLANILIARNAAVFLVAAGYCFHAGEGGPWRNVPINSGNRYFIAIEIENDGRGEPYPEKQREAIDSVSAVLLNRMDHGVGYLPGHKEWAPGRKIDPSYDMDRMRERTREELRRRRRR